MNPWLADAAVRARGLATHLLVEDALRRLARCAGSGVLAGALEAVGYWPAPRAGDAPATAVEAIDAAIEHGVAQRLVLLARWLGDRRELFAGIFEDEQRRAIRFWLRGLWSGGGIRFAAGFAPGASILPRRLRRELAAAADAAALIAALRRARSPYADPLDAARRESGDDLRALEDALDRAFVARARRAAKRLGGRLLSWIEEGIDLDNAWEALAGGDRFLEGGRHLPRERHASVAAAPTAATRRSRLGAAFARTGLAAVFADPGVATADLEARARALRIDNERRAARIDPLGAAPILEFTMRLRAERAALRRINWGIAQGRPPEAILAAPAGRP